MTLTPGDGSTCETAKPVRDRNRPHHFHFGEDGVVRVYRGTQEDCPEFRKYRTADDLLSGRTVGR